MKIASSYSTSTLTAEAVRDAYVELVEKLGAVPTWMAVHNTSLHSGEIIVETLKTVAPGVPFQGGTSCSGVMTEDGYHAVDGYSLGLLGIRDESGIYSVGFAAARPQSRLTGLEAVTRALQKSSAGESPSMIWMTCPPGDEEGILAGIDEGLEGLAPPIIGGSSADNSIGGEWYQITNGRVLHNGVVLTAMYPSMPVHYAFDNSYTPTDRMGIITSAEDRTVLTIDHRPAAEVYNEWTGGLIEDYLDGGNILSLTTLQPLGRGANWTEGSIGYRLTHPQAVVGDRALALFTGAKPGEEVVLMESTPDDLVYRVNRLTEKVLRNLANQKSRIAGALIIYCAGCMLAVGDEIQEVANQFRAELDGQPFLGLFTFGEQGCSLMGHHCHSNLMMSVIVFEK